MKVVSLVKVAEGGAGGGLIVTTGAGATSSASTTPSVSAPGTPNTVEKHDVAKILASLSGLVPEPAAAATAATKSDPRAAQLQAAPAASKAAATTVVSVAKTTVVTVAKTTAAAVTPVTISTTSTGRVFSANS